MRVFAGLRTRLLAAFVLIALGSAATATALAYRDARTAVLQRAQDTTTADFRSRVSEVAAEFDVPPDQSSLTVFADRVAQGLRGGTKVVAVYGELTGTSDTRTDPSRIPPELRTAVHEGAKLKLQRTSRQGEPYLVVGTPVTFTEDGRASGLEAFAITSLRAERDDTAALLRNVSRGLWPALLVAVALALLAARTVLRPVRVLSRATRDLATGRLTSRAVVQGRDELADLARTFNATASALQASDRELREQEAKARRFVADVSHELRTPLAAMTMVTTVLDEEAAAGHLPPDAATAARTVSAETARLARLVEDLMEISRFDAKAARLNATETDLAAAVRASLALRGWTPEVHTELPSDARAVVDRRRIDLVVANLVGNALRHGAPPVELVLTSDGGEVTLSVRDHGPGLAPDVLPHVFDRFYKADSARTRSQGSGLGMAIALENARLHGGTIEVSNAPDGGAVFILRLPRTGTAE
ncbi:ATP-binding protein [Kitasatospora sp. NPDC057542]|uniref:sensor histidine kinase n=1 Tax=Streptomycetaceae TaxID=2062 RepID=UPI001CCA050C|nr:HAMP domain-containing sensor histidine kinase [Streptomyces sp. LS1784]